MSFENKYDLHEELGKGMFGVVKKCRDKETGQVFAAKIIRKTTKTQEAATREVETMKMLKHERLVQLYEAFETDRQMIIVMEYIPGVELFAKVTENDNLTEKQAIWYLKQILLGIQHMHKQYIVHLDIKPENIICKPGRRAGCEEVKLIDFGLAREVLPDANVKVMCGTPEFASPESLSYDPVSIASDMWSIGVVTYVLLSGISPFLGDDDSETIGYVTAGEYLQFEDAPEVFEKITDDAKEFIEDLLITDPKSRNTAEDCLQHPWITKGGGETSLDISKLKAFNAKRKWQKTINAVRAVGRFSFLNRVKKLATAKNDLSNVNEGVHNNAVIPLEKEDTIKKESEESRNNKNLHLPEIVSNGSITPRTSAQVASTETSESELPSEYSKSATKTNWDSIISTEKTNKETSKLADRLKDAKFKQIDISTKEKFNQADYNEILELNSKKKEEETDEEETDEEETDEEETDEEETDEEEMERKKRDEYSNHNGVDSIDEEEEEDDRDDIQTSDRIETLKNDDEEVGAKTATFKNWYRRASTCKQLTSMEQKALTDDIPILYEDANDGAEPKPETNGHNTPERTQSKEEQEILEAISRRLSIKPNNPAMIPSGSENSPNKFKPAVRRGSVPQARLLKGNVKNRLAAFEKK